MVGDEDVDVDGADVGALREALVGGLYCQMELVLRLKVQRFGHSDGAQLGIDGEDAVNIPCNKGKNVFLLMFWLCRLLDASQVIIMIICLVLIHNIVRTNHSVLNI